MNIIVQWSEEEPVIEVSNTDELDRVLDNIVVKIGSNNPIIVFVEAHGYQIGIGLGHKESFVHFEQSSGDPPYMVTVGNRDAEGTVAFYLFGTHHTEVRRRNLIPMIKARNLLYEWIQTEVRPTNIEWEEV
jgi:hypothetical protein